MNERPVKLSPAATSAFLALTLLGLIGGWLILLSGGFHHQYTRYSPEANFVDGVPALVMAAIDFLMTAIGAAALLQSRNARRSWYLAACGAVLLPPLLFVLANWR